MLFCLPSPPVFINSVWAMQTQPHAARMQKREKCQAKAKKEKYPPKNGLEPSSVAAVQKWCHSLHCTLCLSTLFFRGKRVPDPTLPLLLKWLSDFRIKPINSFDLNPRKINSGSHSCKTAWLLRLEHTQQRPLVSGLLETNTKWKCALITFIYGSPHKPYCRITAPDVVNKSGKGAGSGTDWGLQRPRLAGLTQRLVK